MLAEDLGIKDVRLRRNGQDLLWKEIQANTHKESKGALIIYNEQKQGYQASPNNCSEFKQVLQKQGFKVYTIINIQNISIQSESIEHLLKEIIEFYRQNYYVSVVYFICHGYRQPRRDLSMIKIFVRKNGNRTQSQVRQLFINQVFETWKPQCLKHLVIFLEACHMGTATQIYGSQYPHIINISIITSSKEGQFAVYKKYPQRTVMSPLRIIYFYDQGRRLDQFQIDHFKKFIRDNQFQMTGSVDTKIIMRFLNEQIFQQLEQKGIPASTISPIRTSANNMQRRLYSQIRFPNRIQQQQRPRKSIYYGQVQNNIRNNYGMFWHQSQYYNQYQLFYYGQSQKGTFCGKGFKLQKQKSPNFNKTVKGWGNFKKGHLHKQCYIQSKQWYNEGEKKEIYQKRVTTMQNNILSPENIDQKYEITQKTMSYGGKISQQTFHLLIWSQIQEKEITDQDGSYLYQNKIIKLNFTISLDRKHNLRKLQRQMVGVKYLQKDQFKNIQEDIVLIQKYSIIKQLGKICIKYKIPNTPLKSIFFTQCLKMRNILNPFKKFFDKSRAQSYEFKVFTSVKGTRYIGGTYKYMINQNTFSDIQDLVQPNLKKIIRLNNQLQNPHQNIQLQQQNNLPLNPQP